jgi:hypothetical protein
MSQGQINLRRSRPNVSFLEVLPVYQSLAAGGMDIGIVLEYRRGGWFKGEASSATIAEPATKIEFKSSPVKLAAPSPASM